MPSSANPPTGERPSTQREEILLRAPSVNVCDQLLN
jgi:hypothetical protein